MRHFSKNQYTGSGFTIVELLIVIIVIAILAAVSVVAYNGIRARADNSVVEADMSSLAKTIDIWRATNGGVYPTNAQLIDVDIKASKGSYLADGTRNNFYYCVSTNQQQYAFGIISKNNKGYFLTNGVVKTQSASITWQSDTCQQVGHADGSTGASGYVAGSNQWANWVEG